MKKILGVIIMIGLTVILAAAGYGDATFIVKDGVTRYSIPDVKLEITAYAIEEARQTNKQTVVGLTDQDGVARFSFDLKGINKFAVKAAKAGYNDYGFDPDNPKIFLPNEDNKYYVRLTPLTIRKPMSFKTRELGQKINQPNINK